MNHKAINTSWDEGTYQNLESQYNGLNNENFKLKDIKLFPSVKHDEEYLFEDYRTVFDRSELGFLSVHARFYNKNYNQQTKFNKKNWLTKVKCICFKKQNSSWNEIYSTVFNGEISSSEEIIGVGCSCGHEKKGFLWEEGIYAWDVWINGKLLVRQCFFVNDIGIVNSNGNPYFNEVILQFYDYKFKDLEKYYKVFKKSESVEICFDTVIKLNSTKPFYAEFFIEVEKDNALIDYQVWAFYFENIISNSQYHEEFLFLYLPTKSEDLEIGFYKYKVTFLQSCVYSAVIEVSDNNSVEGIFIFLENHNKTIYTNQINSSPQSTFTKNNDDNKTVGDYLKEVSELIGMSEIKKSIHNHVNYLKFLQLRQQKGFADNNIILLHSIFTGNPGTGKTTVVRMLGNIYKSLGLLSKGTVKEVDRSDLVGEYIGQTAIKTKKAIDEARGGILFIDEAYSLARKGISSNDFGLEVIEILLKEMTSAKSDLAIMCAGYPKEMQEFLDANPGLKSRFNHFYEFEDYTPIELLSICEFTAKKNAIFLTEKTEIVLLDKLTKAYRDRDKNFGNARFVNSIINEAKVNLAQRLMNFSDLNSLTDQQLTTVEPEDVEKIFKSKEKKNFQLGIDEKFLEESLKELNSLIGMSNIKMEVDELVKLIRFYIETNRNFLGKFSLHSIFTGNPGTGKTTVARIMAKIYKALGLLERGHLVEVDREALVAGYIGQTAIKTGKKINDAMGGILFIDEAYALIQKQSSNDFGIEAIQILLKRMEDFRGQIGVIVAGYTENMNEFIEANPGLKSRFDRTFHFNDYTPEEMFEIGISLLEEEKLYLDDKASIHLKNYLQHIYLTRDKHFGNARKVRQVIEEIIRKQNLRMASLNSNKRNAETLNTIIFEDVEMLSSK